MALLDSANRLQVFALIMRHWSDLREACSFTKAELSAAVDATDQWIEDNSASFNTALPLAFRTKATALQKTILFCKVALRRAGL